MSEWNRHNGGKKPFPLSRQLTTLAQISFKFSTKIPKKKLYKRLSRVLIILFTFTCE